LNRSLSIPVTESLAVDKTVWTSRLRLGCHESGALLTALLNSQPAGFYWSWQSIQVAQRNGVNVLPADVNVSN